MATGAWTCWKRAVGGKIPENPGEIWKSHRTEFSGGGGAQMYAYDFDGDGDNDVLTSLAAHGYGLAWYEQVTEDGRKTLKQRLIMGKDPMENKYGVAFSQLHGLDLADIDGDGIKDIITGKRYWAHGGRDPGGNDPAVLYWFKTVRGEDGVDFVPYQIDNDSGVGTEVKTGDVNGDGFLDIIVGNKKGTFVHLQKRQKVDEQAWLGAQPMKMFIDGIKPMDQYAASLPPKEAAAAMTLPPGFHATLIAAEPDITQPVTFCFDERGRIWVAEAHDYPFPAEPGEEGSDRILILEDADSDGAFETRKVFAEGLSLVSGLEVGFGGVWVGAAPYLLFIPDRDRDDVPDSEPEILLDGWGTQDTHETLNSFRWGPDGWLYGCHGVFTHSNVGRPGAPEEERTFLNCAVWRYHPVRHEFEVFAHGTFKPLGAGFRPIRPNLHQRLRHPAFVAHGAGRILRAPGQTRTRTQASLRVDGDDRAASALRRKHRRTRALGPETRRKERYVWRTYVLGRVAATRTVVYRSTPAARFLRNITARCSCITCMVTASTGTGLAAKARDITATGRRILCSPTIIGMLARIWTTARMAHYTWPTGMMIQRVIGAMIWRGIGRMGGFSGCITETTSR